MSLQLLSIPKISFYARRLVNEFCHLSVLYADCLPSELAEGMLRNRSYQEQNAHLRRDKILYRLQRAGPISPGSWYSLARALMRADTVEEARSRLKTDRPMVTLFLEMLDERVADYEGIWNGTQPRVEEYVGRFDKLWSPISEKVLTSMSTLAKREWVQGEIRVHFVDCLWGGFAWTDCIAFTPFPDIEVQKKFLAHELSELITPQLLIAERLAENGLEGGIVHTVVDMIAYFSVKDFIARPVYPHPDRRGIRPNPNYYPAAEQLYPFFENYSKNPDAYDQFDKFLQDMLLKLNGSRVKKLA